MTTDLKAARADVESRIETWKSSGYISDRRVAASLSTLLTALDQAAEARDEALAALFDYDIAFSNMDEDSRSSRDSLRKVMIEARRLTGSRGFRGQPNPFRAATVYATLKPVDTKEGEG